MTGVAAAAGRWGDARALRFLLLLLGCWMVVRVLAHWNPAVPPPPQGISVSPWQSDHLPAPWAAAARNPYAAHDPHAVRLTGQANRGAAKSVALHTPDARLADVMSFEAPGRGGDARHGLRLALIARLLPLASGRDGYAALPAGPSSWMVDAALPRTAPPAGGQPYWMQRQLAGWSLGGWVYARGGAGPAPGGIAAAGQLGGSQAGARLAYGFGDSGRVRAYGRATIALAETRQRELAFGLTFAPVARLPVDVAIEQRVAAGSRGRTALAAMVTGGVGDVALPGRFRLEAYGQAGVVGARRRDGFADGAVVVDREVGRTPGASLHLGALAAGAVQPGAARVDVGPRLTLRLPEVGEGSRVALDWRQRVAGDAKPGDGVALTLAADF